MIYCFRDVATNERLELNLSLKEYEERFMDREEVEWEGRTLVRDFASDHAHSPKASNWPLLSEAAGVMPWQVGEANSLNKSRGVDLQYAADGRAIFRDRAHRKQALRQLGMHDKQGGYGD